MSSPTPTTTPAETGFDPLVFWIQHKGKVLLLVAVFVAALTIFAISQLVSHNRAASSQALFATAKSQEEYQKVIDQYPGTMAAGNAYLLVAQKLREAGKFDESSAILHKFIEKEPKHPLLSGAWTSIATNQEAQGKVDDALATYQKVSTGYANSFSAPVALMAQGRLLEGKGKVEEARRVYEQVKAQYADNFVSQQATADLRRLKK